jgi:hypothetical protein
MKNLIIIGARGYGREVYNWATQCKEFNKDWIIKGFLDDNSDALNNMDYPISIISSVEEYVIEKNDVFICALGDVRYKKKYVELMLSKGGVFINLIHPTAQINNFSKIGKGIIICPFCAISNEVIIGNFVTLQGFSAIGHDAKCLLFYGWLCRTSRRSNDAHKIEYSTTCQGRQRVCYWRSFFGYKKC